MAYRVEWRTGGHTLSTDDKLEMLRFEVEDLNAVIKKAAVDAVTYQSIVEPAGKPSRTLVLPLSCFALTDLWTPERLVEGQKYTSYRLGKATTLLDHGFELWPTEVYLNDVADHRNEVHYDLIADEITREQLIVLASGTKAERAAIRGELRPRFQTLLALLTGPHTFASGT